MLWRYTITYQDSNELSTAYTDILEADTLFDAIEKIHDTEVLTAAVELEIHIISR